MLLKAILIGLIAAYGCFDYQLGTLYAFRPITLGPLVGLVLGDLKTGVEIGAALELMFMGSVSVGAYIPPDVTVGGVLATAFAIQLGKGTEAAVALAMPIAVIALGIGNLLSAVMPVFLSIADKGAAEGNYKKVRLTHWIMGDVGLIKNFLLVSIAFYAGSNAVQSALDAIPDFILDGMGIAANMLPAMGFAMLLRMVISKRLIPYLILGFVLISYANIPVLGVALIAIVIASVKFGFFENKVAVETATAAGNEEVVDDEDF